MSYPRPTVLAVTESTSVIEGAASRFKVLTAAAMAARALTDTERPPDERLRTLMEAHGRVQAARGPANPVSFSDFRDRLADGLETLLPADVKAEEMQGVRLITAEGTFDDDLLDLQDEQRVVMRSLAKASRGGGPVVGEWLDDDMDQERAYMALKKSMDQRRYVTGRRAYIEHPAGSEQTLRKLGLSSAVAGFYAPISHAAIYDRWWFGCPICHWPMKILIKTVRGRKTGHARCFHAPHASRGANYHFRPPKPGAAPALQPTGSPPSRPNGSAAVLFTDTSKQVPPACLAEGHKALIRGVWRWTTIPGRVEVDLFNALSVRGLDPIMWPDLDAYDLEVTVGTGARQTVFRIDVKDYTSALLLAQKVQADGGDAGGANWLVVPDYRDNSLPLLRTICEPYGLRVATAGQIGQAICDAAGVAW